MSSEIYLSGPLFAEPEIGRTANNEPSVKILLLTELVRKKGGLYKIATTILPISCYCQSAAQAAHLRQGDHIVVQTHLFGTAFRPPGGPVRHGLQLRVDEIILPRRSASVMPTARATKN